MENKKYKECYKNCIFELLFNINGVYKCGDCLQNEHPEIKNIDDMEYYNWKDKLYLKNKKHLILGELGY